MAVTPERSKYTDVASALEADVRAGRWDGGKLPSVRNVASTYHVSVVTASRALQVLRDKGLIRTIERSGCYRVAPPDAERWAIVLRLTSGPMIGLTTSLVRDGFEAFARTEPMHLHFDSFDIHDGLTVPDAEAAAATAKANGIHGVVLLPSRSRDQSIAADRAFVEGCHQAGLPLVLFERGQAGTDGTNGCDLVTIDDVMATAHATRHLYDTGRTSVACVTASDVSSHRDRLAGYLLAHHTAGLKSKPIVFHQDSSITPGEAFADLAVQIIKSKVDAVVCYSDYAAWGILVELQRKGKKIPKDVAITGFDNLLIGEQFPIQLTTIRYPAVTMAWAAIRLLRDRILDPKRTAVRVSVAGELIIRSSSTS